MPHHSEPRLALCEFLEDFRSAVRRAIIDENNFPVMDRAVEEVDCSSQKGFDEELFVIAPGSQRNAVIELTE
jgi:hypothetical protein